MSARDADHGDLFLPNAIWGRFADAPGPEGFRIYATSEGVTERIAAWIDAACATIGRLGSHFPQRGVFLQVPPLSSGDGLESGPEILALAVSASGYDSAERFARCFHATYVGPEAFEQLSGETIGLWRAGLLLAGWGRNPVLPLIRVSRRDQNVSPLPTLSNAEADGYGERLLHVLSGGVLRFRSPQPDDSTEEALRVVHLGLPMRLKATLGFGTFIGLSPKEDFDPTAFQYAIAGCHGSIGQHVWEKVARRQQVLGGEAELTDYVTQYVWALRSRNLASLLQLTRTEIQADLSSGTIGVPSRDMPWWKRFRS